MWSLRMGRGGALSPQCWRGFGELGEWFCMMLIVLSDHSFFHLPNGVNKHV